MSRQLRVEFPGALYHVTSRGNMREAVFRDDSDKALFLKVLGEAAERFTLKIHAYCLMDNHYHLLVETPLANLSAAMRHINGIYTQTFNFRRGKAGHLFQGRYKGILVKKEDYLLEVCRYIVLNPVRAGLCRNPADWRWSSYSATAGHERPPEFLNVSWLLSQFGSSPADSARKYSDFVNEAAASNPFEHIRKGLFLGDDEFVKSSAATSGRITAGEEVAKEQRFAARPALQELIPPRNNRWKNALRAVDEFGYTQKEVADFLSVHYTTVSRHLRRKSLNFKT